MNNTIEYDLGNDPSLLILDDDEPFTRTLGRAMERRGFKQNTLSVKRFDTWYIPPAMPS